jgi:hypothetical protein
MDEPRPVATHEAPHQTKQHQGKNNIAQPKVKLHEANFTGCDKASNAKR